MARASQNIIDLKAKLSGPFFAPDAKARPAQNIRKMLVALADEGEQTVRAETPARSGATQAGIVGRVESLSGTPWWLHATISQQRAFPWANRGQRGSTAGGQAVYRGGRLEAKLHMFRRVTNALRASRAVIRANLTEGLE